MKAYLLLEDGHLFTGYSIGVEQEAICEVVFTTSMTGYIETLTDPSYAGQGVVMTYPLIGNYGYCVDDGESSQPHVSAFILRELSRYDSNFRSQGNLNDYLKQYNIPGIAGIDTRALTKILRDNGTMNGMITTNDITDIPAAIEKIKAYKHKDLVEKVTCDKIYHANTGDSGKIAVIDYGCKRSIIKRLSDRGFDVTVLPASITAEEVINGNFDGLMLSNGPGDPAECKYQIEQIKKLFDYGMPTFAICLGHQLASLALGAKTEKLKYGHRGANHPVRDLSTNHCYITSQNHGYVVNKQSLLDAGLEIAFENVNDGTVEGFDVPGKKIFTTQFHPEACGGPLDTGFLFDRFKQMISK